MRIKIEFETENENLPIEYRKKFLSYFKSVIWDYNEDLFAAMYSGKTLMKPFCSSLYFLPEVEISTNGIALASKRFSVKFTTPDILTAVHILNAFVSRKNKWLPLSNCDNKVKVLSVSKINEKKINGNSAMLKILSPIVIRDHNRETGNDWYFVFEDEKFEETWKRNLKSELDTNFSWDVAADIDALKMIPIQLKKVVVKNYNIYVPCTIGTMVLEGENYLLEYLYKAGIGSKRSMGFGYIDVI